MVRFCPPPLLVASRLSPHLDAQTHLVSPTPLLCCICSRALIEIAGPKHACCRPSPLLCPSRGFLADNLNNLPPPRFNLLCLSLGRTRFEMCLHDLLHSASPLDIVANNPTYSSRISRLFSGAIQPMSGYDLLDSRFPNARSLMLPARPPSKKSMVFLTIPHLFAFSQTPFARATHHLCLSFASGFKRAL